ncbi:unnamed protein product [Cylicocyclus nassatus]|uniref:RRM domain-containing protein n=1 Tax=Cylicocyclus nassatus TaxID=53992 RepID=A0AA36LYJ5_CYLNA|nr:unnamed protein product [Cylicocyclus nassatus]
MDGGKLSSAISMESLNSVSTESCSQVRTLFVSGLPMDAKPRELYLLFRAYRGYESSLLKMTAKNGKPTSPGVRFDPDCAQVLRLELAKSNTKSMPQFLAPLQPTEAIVLDQHPLLFDQHQLLSLSLPRFPAAQSLPFAGFGSRRSESSPPGLLHAAFAGFTRLRMHTKNGSSVAFIEYSSLASATSAMMALQGFQLGSSERGGLRIEYARNKMADVNG